MVRIKAVSRAMPASRGLASKKNLYVRRNTPIRSPAKEHNASPAGPSDAIEIPDDDDDDDDENETEANQDYPSPAPTTDQERPAADNFEIISRIPKKSRKKYPSDAPRTSRPPFLPPIMQVGCIQEAKFKAQSGWDVIKYCLDCVRPHLILYCDGTYELLQQVCNYHHDHSDSTLRPQDSQRVRDKLEMLFFKHGIMDSRPFTVPILKHHDECSHEDEDEGFDTDILEKMKETLEWGRAASESGSRSAALAKVDAPEKAAQPTPPQSHIIKASAEDEGRKEKASAPERMGPEVIMIDD